MVRAYFALPARMIGIGIFNLIRYWEAFDSFKNGSFLHKEGLGGLACGSRFLLVIMCVWDSLGMQM